jgi:hypothetical protein
MTMLPLNRFPISFKDPLYATLAATIERKLNLPSGILDAIRLRGERSNADQVSPAGARGPYQFIAPTRQGFIREHGIDPWSDASTQTEAAGIHLLDDYKRTGSWNEAIARYNGGQRPGSAARRYQARVGDFDTSKPYYAGADAMPYGQSIYPVGMEASGVDPLAPERPKMPIPIPNDPGMSANAAAASPVASKKRGGILGALESVFMPDPGSRWAGALRDGLFNAKESQRNYLEDQISKQLNLQTANAKLKQLMSGGEYRIVGNNVLHIKNDGGYELISPPQNEGDKIKLYERWVAEPPGPGKDILERMLLGTNSDEAMRNREQVARTRAGATTGAARIRANATSKGIPPLPPGFSVVK